MNTNKKIRVIKREQQSGGRKAAETTAPNSENLRHTTREVAGQVAAWVKEIQERRPVDPRRAFARLFGEPALHLSQTP